MTYKLGNRSNERLEGVDASLQAVVRGTGIVLKNIERYKTILIK